MQNRNPKIQKEVDIKRAAIERVAEEGWIVEQDNCRVTPVLPGSKVTPEIGPGWTSERLLVTKWIVDITTKSPANKVSMQLRVIVELAWNKLYAVFDGL